MSWLITAPPLLLRRLDVPEGVMPAMIQDAVGAGVEKFGG